MNVSRNRDRAWVLSAFSGGFWLLSLACPLGATAPARAADEAKPAEERRTAVGKCLSPTGSLLSRKANEQTWQVVRKDDAVHSGDSLLAPPGGRAEVERAGLRLTLWGNLPQLSSVPVLESVVRLHDNPSVDLDLTLDRGRIVIVSPDKDVTRVRVHIRDLTWECTLPEKGDAVSLERYGRWPRGVPFSAKPTAEQQPTAEVIFLVLKGSAELKAGTDLFTLRAPPGSAYFHWDSAHGFDSNPLRVAKLPAWAEPGAERTTEARRDGEVQAALRERLRDKAPAQALLDLLHSADRLDDRAQAAMTREVAVCGLGAINDLAALMSCLTDAEHASVRDAAIEALRQYIGRGPGQDGKLYDFLQKQEKATPTQAEIVLELLHTPFEADRPETYETLIEYLRHGSLAVRELARWHLYRLAPAGSAIAYNAAGAAPERDEAYKKWKELIPTGKLPPAPK